MYLLPWSKVLARALDKIDDAFFTQAFGTLASRKQDRFRTICRLEDPLTRRDILARKVVLRYRDRRQALLAAPQHTRRVAGLQAIGRTTGAMPPYEALRSAMTAIRVTPEAKEYITEFGASRMRSAQRATELHRKRRVPLDRPLQLPAILKIRRTKTRRLALQFAYGRFPPRSTSALDEVGGARVTSYLSTVRNNLQKYELAEDEEEATRLALDALAGLCGYCAQRNW